MNRRNLFRVIAAFAAAAAVPLTQARSRWTSVYQQRPEDRPWRIYIVNECELWVARSPTEMKRAYLKEVGEPVDPDWFREIPDAELDTLLVLETDEDGNPILLEEIHPLTGKPRQYHKTRSMRAELNERIAMGLDEPEFFAGDDW